MQPTNYPLLLADIKIKIREAQVKATLSATEQTGKDAILGYIAEVNEDIFKNGGAF